MVKSDIYTVSNISTYTRTIGTGGYNLTQLIKRISSSKFNKYKRWHQYKNRSDIYEG